MDTLARRRSLGIVVALACATRALSWPARAKSPSDGGFDQGIDAGQTLKDLKPSTIAGFELKILPIKARLSLWSADGRVSAQGGYVLSDIQGRLSGATDEIYRGAVALRGQEGYKNLPSDVLEPLDLDWVEIENARVGLIHDAQGFDQQDAVFKDENDRNEELMQDLQNRQQAAQEEKAAWDENCLGRSLPPDEYDSCLTRKNQIQAEAARINQDIAQFNASVEKFNQGVLSARESGNSWWENIVQAWILTIRRFTFLAKNAIDNPRRTCTDEQHHELTYKMGSVCKGPPRSCKPESLDCQELKVRYRRNIDCAAARDEINRACYGGGNALHQDLADEARELAQECKAKIDEACGSAGLMGLRP